MSDKKKLLRLAESVYSRPHLISHSGFAVVANYLDARNLGALLMELDDDGPNDNDGDEVNDPMSGVGYIEVSGALTYKPIYGMCGEVGCSYESLTSDVAELIEQGIHTLVMTCDSPGGEGYGAFETADKIRSMCDEAGVRWIAYNDGMIASAMYAIACAADEVISNPAAETGSIGVLVALTNINKALQDAGIQRSYIYAGDSKIPFDEDGGWKPEFLSDIQDKVDALYGTFVDHVSKYTGLDASAVKDTQAKIFMAPAALELGLINKVMTHSEFIDYIAAHAETQTKETT